MDYKSQLAELENENNEIKANLLPIRRERAELMRRVANIDCEENKSKLIIKDNEKEIQKIKELISIEDILIYLKNIPDFALLTQDDILIIINGIDKMDYSLYNIALPRYCDAQKIIKLIVDIKHKYPGFTLSSIQRTGLMDVLPPVSVYSYIFKTPEGGTFTI